MKWLKLKDQNGPVLLPADKILYIKSLPEKQGTRVFIDRANLAPVDVLTPVSEIETMLVKPKEKPGQRKNG